MRPCPLLTAAVLVTSIVGAAAATAGAAVAADGALVPAATRPSAPAPATRPTATKVDVDAFDAARKAEGVVVLDVRSPEEFAAGHVPGAVNVPVAGKGAAGFDRAAAAAVGGKTALVYCHSGVRSGKAVKQLAAAGSAAAIVEMPAGWVGWKRAEKPVEMGAAKPVSPPAEK